MLGDNSPSSPQPDNANAQQKNYLETILRQTAGDCRTLRPMMLKDLHVLVTESDWALSTIHDVEYIKPLEEYCEKAQPCDVPLALPKLLTLIGKSSECECLRICESSFPSFFLEWIISLPDEAMIKNSVKAHLPHLKDLSQLCFTPHPEVSKLTLKALCTRSRSDSEIRAFLKSDGVSSVLTNGSSEVVPFAKQLCGRMVEHISQMKSLSEESSPSDQTISPLSATLPDKSPLFSGNAMLAVLCEELSLIDSLFGFKANTTQFIPLNSDVVTLLKSIIIVCLDQLDQQKTASNCPRSDRTVLLVTILDSSWNCVLNHLYRSLPSDHRDDKSAFSDDPSLCFLLERTYNRPSPTHSSRLGMIIHLAIYLPNLIPLMLKENLIQRVIDTSKLTTVPTTHRTFHLDLIQSVATLIGTPNRFSFPETERKPLQQLQFERALKPAKQYLKFILQRDEFFSKDDSRPYNVPTIVSELLKATLLLERELFENGMIVETGREEWEVGWLVEMTRENSLGWRLEWIRRYDVKIEKNEKSRWKKRVKRLRVAGHEDAMEGWLTRRDNQIPLEVEEYVESVSEASGMNNTQ
ncbi:hypothetical protein BLNAU_2093 [Blattamonas nauphoetae]|uniref:Uncharacterized protein n=1 Tax=Blattamonas nauphoetae TaxID=2049346 RepID=A0ABQ9YH29_9EUKA|nr:hypothetical protein BLNAU_2093 [Blattamonas nauphoetae]